MKPKLVLSELPAGVTRLRLRRGSRRRARATSCARRRPPIASAITAVDVFDVYEGAGIPDGKKSVAVAVTLQPTEKTLTDAEIDEIAARIVAEVGKKTAATLR